VRQDGCQKRMAKRNGATGIPVWNYEHLDADGWTRVAHAAQAFPFSEPEDQFAAVTADSHQ
jgi:hypothetical protein